MPAPSCQEAVNVNGRPEASEASELSVSPEHPVFHRARAYKEAFALCFDNWQVSLQIFLRDP